jgi:hypothetical protein
LKLPEGCKFSTGQELQGRSYCKWHHSLTHNTSDCKELRRQIQSAIEQGRLILGQNAMKVDTQPFLSVNMVEGYDRSARRQLDFALGINMQGLRRIAVQGMKRPIPTIGPKKGKRDTSRKNK